MPPRSGNVRTRCAYKFSCATKVQKHLKLPQRFEHSVAGNVQSTQLSLPLVAMVRCYSSRTLTQTASSTNSTSCNEIWFRSNCQTAKCFKLRLEWVSSLKTYSAQRHCHSPLALLTREVKAHWLSRHEPSLQNNQQPNSVIQI